MKRPLVVPALLLALAACDGGSRVVVQASLEEEGPVADLPVRLLPYDRQAILDSLAADREELRAGTAERDALAAGLAELTARLTAARGADPDLAARVARLSATADACDAVVGALAGMLGRRLVGMAAQRCRSAPEW